MKISSITPSKHVKGRFILTMEDESVIKVTLDQIADYGLFSGRELSDEEYGDMTRDAAVSGSRARALRILGARNMSRAQIIRRLTEKGESPELAADTADWLESIGAVNDGEYAALIVSHYVERGYGMAKIKEEMIRRGIPSDIAAEALAQVPALDDEAYAFIEKKLGGAPFDRLLCKKAADAAVRRGFSWEEIRTALSRYEAEHEVSY